MKTLIRFSALFLILSAASATLAQTTSFTYQGRMADGGTAANGNYDLQFTLWDAASGGTQQPASAPVTVTRTGIAVANGIFTTQLDFGANAFPGANRFLEIGARLSGGGAFTILSPRQQISSTPYAIRALSAASADTATNATNATQLGGVAANQYVLTGDTRLTDARQPVAGSNNYIQNQSATGQAASFNIAGDGVIGGKVRIGTSDLSSAFRLAVEAPASGGVFVSAVSTAVNGTSTSSTGVFGSSSSSVGVHGVTASGDSSSSGVRGVASGPPGGVGVRGEGTTGVLGTGTGQGSVALRASGTSWFRGDTTPLNSTVASGTGIGIGSVPASNYGYIFGFDYSTNQARALALNHPGGNVGIGTTTPQTALQVRTASGLYGFTHTDGTVTVGSYVGGSSSGATGGWLGTQSNDQLHFFTANGPAAMTISRNREVGINTISPDSTLSVNGTASKLGGGSWASFSDERLKTITGRFTPGLKAVMQLQPLRYNYRVHNVLGLRLEGEHVGFGAQAVAKIIPEAVTKNDKGYLLVNNDPILWTMLNAIKEQQAQISELRRRLNVLERARQSTVGKHRHGRSTGRWR